MVASEVYVAVPDNPQRFQCLKKVVQKLKSDGVPECELVILYRWFPNAGENADFAFGPNEKQAVIEGLAA